MKRKHLTTTPLVNDDLLDFLVAEMGLSISLMKSIEAKLELEKDEHNEETFKPYTQLT